MKQILLVYTLIFIYLSLSYNAVSSTGDSLFLKYRNNNTYQTGTFTWDSKYPFYLVEKKIHSVAEEHYPITVRRLNSLWEIINYDPAISYKSLMQFFSTVVPANNEWKFSQRLESISKKDPWSNQTVRIGFIDSIFARDSTFFTGKATVVRWYPDYHTADIRIYDLETLRQLTANRYITSASIFFIQPYTEQAVNNFDLGTNYISKVHDDFPGNSGAGTTVSIKEDLFDTTDIDFKNRYFPTAYASTTFDNHANIIATMIGGSGNSYYLGKGVAWKTKLTSAGFINLMPEPISYYEQNHIDVQNHSYGTDIENEYAADAAAYDFTSWKDSSLLHVFSAGNSGTATPITGLYAGVAFHANLTGSFKMSKNSLAIGGTDSFYHTEILSSKGPAYDGRIKPELVAYGIDGTSGAAAIVSGTALLLQQALKQQSGLKPAASLVKAILINGSDDIDAEGPDFASGYGSLNANRSMQIATDHSYYTGNITQGQVSESTITIPGNTAWIKATLCWTDTPASILSSTAIVNDLDVELQNINDGTIIKPWILSTAANSDSLSLAAKRGKDSLNVVEQISFISPVTGEYRVIVRAHKIITSSQSFAVAWYAEKEDIVKITYPSKTDAFFGDSKQIVRWQSSFLNITNAKLEYAYAGSAEWNLITGTLPLKQLWYEWQTPDTTAKALLRITNSSNTFTSDTIIISKPLAITVGYHCDDSVYLFWQKQEAKKYRVYTLGDTLLQPVIITADTFYKTAIDINTSTHIAVAPVIENEEAVKSYTIDFTKQGVGCYINNFLADLFGDSVRLELTLGTLYNIHHVILQKQLNGNFTAVDSTTPLQLVTYFTDNKLLQGGNSYRVKLALNNGNDIYSQLQTIYYLGNKLYLLYPNPTQQNQSISIVNRFYDGDLYANIYDITGRLIKKVDLLMPLNKISLAAFPAGIYILVFNDGNKKLGFEKLVIQ